MSVRNFTDITDIDGNCQKGLGEWGVPIVEKADTTARFFFLNGLQKRKER